MGKRAGLKIIKKYEGCKLAAYLCPASIWTIGYGHTFNVHEGDTCTQAQADQWLNEDYDQAEEQVLNAVTTDLTDNQLGALASFVYNVGLGVPGEKDGFLHVIGGGPSHLLIYCNRGEFDLAADQFPLWDKAAGVVLLGLYNRRMDEKGLFRTP